ncbi:MAG: hypothetical protein ABR583_12495 [Gaiellaceae bacterium]
MKASFFARWAVLAAVALLAGCGGSGKSNADELFDLAPARSCFEQAVYGTSAPRADGGARELVVYPSGETKGRAYVTLTFAASHDAAVKLAGGSPETSVRGNVVVRGPGSSDDVVSQCLLEAKRPG